MKVYIVLYEYHDYTRGIVVVFSSREAAEIFVGGRRDYEIEEQEVLL